MKNRAQKINNRSPRWKRSVINAAVAMSLSAAYAPTVLAADYVISVGETDPYTLTLSDSLTVTTGTLIVSASSAAVTVDAAANGVTIDNSGTISQTSGFNAIEVDAAALDTTIINQFGASISASSTYAIYFAGNLDGSLTNDGTILSSGNLLAAGVFAVGSLNGAIDNTGDINATATGAGGATAYGIHAGGMDAGASIINDGDIVVSSTASSGDAYAYGIQAGDLGDGTAIENNSGALISVTADATETSAEALVAAYGISTGDLGVDASIINDGEIEVTATVDVSGISTEFSLLTGYGYPSAGGIYAGSLGAGASIVNGGTITAVVETSASGDVSVAGYATGISASDLGDGASISNSNSGTITVTATGTGTGDVTAQGISAGALSGIDATVTNDNAINATATAADGEASATGIYAASVGAGTSIENSNDGIITVSATNTGTGKATANGVEVDGLSGIDATIINDDTITATATTSAAGDGYAAGIYAASVGAGASIENSIGGIISVTANATTTSTVTASATARGIQIGTLSGMDATVTNNDEINAAATASAAGDGYAVGMYAASVGAGASLDNSGTITATAEAKDTSTVDATVTARGIEVGTLTGADTAVTNSSIINATATAKALSNGDVNAAGMYVNSLGSGATITNSSFGTITVTAVGEATSTIEATATAHGIGAGTLSGMVMNDAEINVIATAAGAGEAYAAGIHANSLSSGASISGGGTFTADATSTGTGAAYALGIEAGTLSGTITNDLTIAATATAEAAGDVYAVAIHADSLGSVATINGSGTITADATTTGAGAAYARGIELDTLSGTLTNNLAIEVTAEAAGNVYATGIYTDSSANASINGSSTMAADAIATGTGIATARGIEIVTPSGTMTNYLTIEATATGTSGNADSYGVDAGSMSGGASIINSSAITAEAHVTDGAGASAASAYGMFADGMSGTGTSMTNTSEIVANATGTVAGDSAKAYGMRATSLDDGAEIANDGTIDVSVSEIAGTAKAYGIYVGSLNSAVRNSGIIIATAPAATGDNAYSVFAESGTGEVSNSGRMVGRVDLGGTVSMTNTGLLSIANTSGKDSTIGKDYTQSGTGVLRVGVTSASNFTQLGITGTAKFEGAANISVEVQGNGSGLVHGVKMDNVVAAGILETGLFNITDNSLAWQFAAANDLDNHIDLTPSSTGMTTLAAVAGSSGTAGVAKTIDAILAGTASGDAVEALYTLTSLGTAAEVAAALHSFTPVLGGNAAQSMVDMLRSGATSVVREHLQDDGGLSSGDGTLSEDSFWIKPFGSWAKQKDRSGASGYKADSFGLVVGRDKKISDQWNAGGAFSYSGSKVASTSGAQNVNIKTYQAALYATNHFNETNVLNLQLDIGRNDNDSHRAVANSVASANYDSRHTILSAELERSFRLSGKTTLTPAVGVEYVNVNVNSYAESGSPVSLSVIGHSQKALVLSLGGTAVYKLDDEASLTGSLNLGHDLKAEQAQVTSSFVNFGGSTFVTNGINPSANVIRAGLGYEIQKASGTTVVTNYDMETKSSGYTNHMLSVNLKTPF